MLIASGSQSGIESDLSANTETSKGKVSMPCEVYCKECSGVSICPHGHVKYVALVCKKCDESQICTHGKIRTTCRLCGGRADKAKERVVTVSTWLCEVLLQGVWQFTDMHTQLQEGSLQGVRWFADMHTRKTQVRLPALQHNNSFEQDFMPSWASELGISARTAVNPTSVHMGAPRPGAKTAQDTVDSTPDACMHGREKYYCKDCGGAGICVHVLQKPACKVCTFEKVTCEVLTETPHSAYPVAACIAIVAGMLLTNERIVD